MNTVRSRFLGFWFLNLVLYRFAADCSLNLGFRFFRFSPASRSIRDSQDSQAVCVCVCIKVLIRVWELGICGGSKN